MALESSDKSFFVSRLVLVSAITALVAIAVLLAGFDHFLLPRIERLFAEVKAVLKIGGSGDTPVVLVGDSMKFKDEDQTDTGVYWSPVTANKAYSLTPTYPISTIAIKAKPASDSDIPPSDDRNAATDLIEVDVSQAASWKIDEYTSAGIVASITNSGNQINLALAPNATGLLCPATQSNIVKITYTSDTCPGTVKFTQIGLTVTAANGQPITSGTLACADENGAPGKCRIVLRK